MRLNVISELKIQTQPALGYVLTFCYDVWSWNTKSQIAEHKRLFGDTRLLVQKLAQQYNVSYKMAEAAVFKMCAETVHKVSSHDEETPYVMEEIFPSYTVFPVWK